MHDHASVGRSPRLIQASQGVKTTKNGFPWGRFVGSLPLSLSGLALGVAGLGNMLASAGALVHVLCGCIATALWLLVAARCALFPRTAAGELNDSPAAAGGFAGFFMCALLISAYVREWALGPGQALWVGAAACYVLYTAWFTCVHVRLRKFAQWYPSCLMPYAGLALASVTLPPGVPPQVSAAFLWTGSISFVVLLPLLALRHLRFDIPDQLRPFNCMFAGPPGVIVSGVVMVYAASCPPNALVALLVASQMLLLLVILRLPRFLRLPFAPSYAAFTFSFLAAASGFGAGLSWLRAQDVALPRALDTLLMAEQALAACLTCYVVARFALFLTRLWKEAARPN